MPFSITKRELARIDERIEAERSLDALRALTQRLADDLRLARDRLERTPSNSSMPSAAWRRGQVPQARMNPRLGRMKSRPARACRSRQLLRPATQPTSPATVPRRPRLLR